MSIKEREGFPESFTGGRAAAGVTACLMYCVGLEVLVCSISPVFRVLSFALYLVAIVLFSKSAFGSLKNQSWKKIVGWTLLTILLLFAVSECVFGNLIEPILMKVLCTTKFSSANTASIAEQIRNGSAGHTAWMIFGCCILGPMVEELLYRVALFRVLYQKNKSMAHIITAFLFGLQHVFVAAVYGNHPQEFLLIGSYMAYSYILTKRYEKTKTPVPGMLAHMIINTAGVILML